LPHHLAARDDHRVGGAAAGRADAGKNPCTIQIATAAAPAASPPAAAAVAPAESDEEIKPLIGEADPEFERLLAEEEEIERSTREHHETPHFRPGDGD